MLATHASTGLTVSAIGVIIAAATLLTSRSVAAFELVKAVDYKTLFFFIGLFIVVGGLEVSGILIRDSPVFSIFLLAYRK